MRLKFLLLAFLSGLNASAQTLRLEDCYEQARSHYPLIRQRELILKSRDFSVLNASKGYLPQVNFAAQATYQSEVTRVPISFPGVDIPTPTKDQYKVYADLNQTLYDGGLVKKQKAALEANAALEDQKLETELYKLKDRINQLFFGILMIEEQLKQVSLLKSDIEAGEKKTQAGVENGIMLKNNLDNLRAEYLKADQRATELNTAKEAYIEMLGLFLNKHLSPTVTLAKPLLPESVENDASARPELRVFDLQNKGLDIQDELISQRKMPRLSFFLQTGLGKPALNMLSNSFEPYFLGGLRLNWSLSSFYTEKNDRALISIQRAGIAVQREAFLFNISYTTRQQRGEVSKFAKLQASDQEIIALRGRIKSAALAQLNNGVINASDYLKEVNAEDQARQNKILHDIQLLMAQFNLLTTTGQ